MFELQMTAAKPMHLVLTSSSRAHTLHKLNSEVHIYVSNALVSECTVANFGSRVTLISHTLPT